MADIDEDWELVGKTLQKAINIYLPEFKVDSSAALKKLTENSPRPFSVI